MHTQEIENNHTHKTVELETDYHTNYIILYIITYTTYNPTNSIGPFSRAVCKTTEIT